MIIQNFKPKKRTKIKPKFILFILGLLVIFGAFIAANIYLEVIQLDEIGGFSSVYWTNFTVIAITFVVSFILLFLLLFVTNIFVKKNGEDFYREAGASHIHIPDLLISFVLAFLGAFVTRKFFLSNVLNFINSESFGKVDPIFKHDIGYYIFQRPFLMSIFDYLSTAMLFIIFFSVVHYLAIAYFAYGNFTANDLKKRGFIVHNIINISLFFLIKAASYRFSMESILYNDIKGTRGAGYIDINIWKNFYMMAPVIILVLLVLTFIFVFKGKTRLAVYSTLTYPAIFIVVSIVASLMQTLIVDPSELSKEKPYLANSIQQTREAYNVNTIEEESFDLKQNMDTKIINNNLDTINNIRVVDYNATLRSNNQLQSIRTYFSFNSGDIINYNINGSQTPVFIAARELDSNKIPDNSNFVNTMFKYTHGYGIVINPINSFSSSGQVNYILRDIEQNSTDPSLKVKEPRIYYGELTNNYVVVNANGISEIDKDVSDETRYSGKGGIKLGFLNKLLFSLSNGDLNMLMSGYIKDDSKLLLNRNILDRVKKAAPFLEIDNDPYIILSDEGHLLWVFDAYTESDQYPYSQSYGDFNYIRNSVKAVVDAYDGKVKLYDIDKTDPIIKTYKKIYPAIFSNGELPKTVKDHMRYPEKLYKIQADVLKRYHFDPSKDPKGVEVFYNKQDVWELAKYPDMQNDNKTTEMEPYYNMIKLPKDNSKTSELIVMTAFAPHGKENMVSWLAAKNSFDEYGKFVLFTFPKQRQVYGPNQVESQINQQSEISTQMSLWGKEGSKVFKGNLLAIPIEDSILFVEPLYTESTNGVSIPQVKEVILGYQTGEDMKIVYGATLSEALQKLFSESKAGSASTPESTATPESPTVNNSAALQKVIDTFSAAKKSMNGGDWEGFGKSMKELEGAINGLPK